MHIYKIRETVVQVQAWGAEDVGLNKRVEETQVAVTAALTDNFNTPQVNLELPISQNPTPKPKTLNPTPPIPVPKHQTPNPLSPSHRPCGASTCQWF